MILIVGRVGVKTILTVGVLCFGPCSGPSGHVPFHRLSSPWRLEMPSWCLHTSLPLTVFEKPGAPEFGALVN
jgi:hypothetical protein